MYTIIEILESRSEDEVTLLYRVKPEGRGRPTVVNASKLKKAIGPVSIAKAPRSRGNASQHMDEAIERVVNHEMSSQEAIEECQRRRGLNDNDSTDQESQSNEVVRPDSRANDSFADNVNEVLKMLDRESNEQDQEQEAGKEQEAAELSDHESNDQDLLSEPESDQHNEPELH